MNRLVLILLLCASGCKISDRITHGKMDETVDVLSDSNTDAFLEENEPPKRDRYKQNNFGMMIRWPK